MTPRDTIERLLEHYQDALEEHLVAKDSEGGTDPGDVLQLMGATWNDPAYQELERLRLRLRATKPRIYWHLAERYLRAVPKRVMRCANGLEVGALAHNYQASRRCTFTMSVADYYRARGRPVHRHGARSYSLLPAIVYVHSSAVDEECVDAALDWLLESWNYRIPLQLPYTLIGMKVLAS